MRSLCEIYASTLFNNNENVAEFCVRQTAATLGGNEQHDEEIPVGGDGNGAEV